MILTDAIRALLHLYLSTNVYLDDENHKWVTSCSDHPIRMLADLQLIFPQDFMKLYWWGGESV